MKKRKVKCVALTVFFLIIVSVTTILPVDQPIKIVLDDDAEPVTMDEEVIEYKIVNRSLWIIHFGAYFFVEKNMDGNWEKVKVPENIAHDLWRSSLLPLCKSKSISFYKDLYVDEPGQYRIAKPVDVGRKNEEVVVYCVFIVE